jgi:ribosomal protein S27AE
MTNALDFPCGRCGSKARFKSVSEELSRDGKMRDDDVIRRSKACQKCGWILASELTTRRLERVKRDLNGMTRRLQHLNREGKNTSSLTRAIERKQDMRSRLEAELERQPA